LKSLTNLVVAIHHESAYKESSSSREIQMKAKKAIAKIEEIMELKFDGYGEFMTTTERYRMINSVIYSYKKSLFEKESQDADPRG
jgi:hypothetical protein